MADQPAFSASPQSLQAAFAGIQPAGDDATMLLDEVHFEFDLASRKTFRRRMIIKIWTKDGAEDWASLEAVWSPSLQDRPVVRARVISPDGTVRELDPKTISEGPAGDSDQGVFSDRRALQVPLPAIEPGAVIEEEILERETRNVLESGAVGYYTVGDIVPVHRTRVTVRVPQSLPLKFKTYLLPEMAVRDRTENGMRQLDFEQPLTKPLEDAPELLPFSEPRSPHIVFSTGKDWQSLATEYAAIIERQIRDFDARANLPPIPAGADRDAKIRAIAGKLNREIRYTGIEFGEASMIPWTPAEVLERKYGDCKDKATLAVALLRAAGVEAHVALLRSSFGQDVEADLPGASMFNHAIVYAPGSPDYWLDFTDIDVRLGVLAAPNQGRWSLIARPQTTALIRTPEMTAQQNRVIETREFILPELGRARIIESSETFGTLDRAYRGGFAGRTEQELKDDLKSYIASEYGDAKIGKITPGDADDLSVPYKLRIELDDAQRGSSERTEAAAAIFVSHVLHRLPGFFLTDPKKEQEANSKPALPRTQDFYIAEPYELVWQYKITAPPGFRVRQLPPASNEALASTNLSISFTEDSPTQVSATVRFTVPKKRYTAAEGLELREAALALSERKPLIVYFDQIGETALATGDVKQALTEFEALRKLHPNEALHSLQYARALLMAGAGESARAEARRAVALEPGSASGFVQLGEVLSSDLVGRPTENGMDRDGAIEAYRKALELDPGNVTTRANLAILLEHDNLGRRYAAGSRLDEALAEYQKIADKLAEVGLAQNYPIAMLQAGRAAELLEYLRNQPDTDVNQTLRLCAEAILRGTQAAVQRAGDIAGLAVRQRLLTSAGQTLLQVRRYELAAGLLEASAAGSQNPAAVAGTVQLLKSIKPLDSIPGEAATPEDAIRVFMARAVAVDRHESDWDVTLSPLLKGSDKVEADELRRQVMASRGQVRATGLSEEVLADLIYASMQFAREGDDQQGYQIHLSFPGMAASGMRDMTFFVAKESEGYRVVGMPEHYAGVARLVLNLLDAGRLEDASVWLDRVRRALPAGGADDPLSGPTFSRLWQANQAGARDADQARRAAVALLVRPGALLTEPQIQVLEQARAGADEATAIHYLELLGDAYLESKQYEKARQIASSLFEQLPRSRVAFSLLLRVAYSAGGVPEGRRLLDANIGRFAQETDTLRATGMLAMAFGDYERSKSIARQIIDSGRAGVGDYNQFAWADVMAGTVTQESFDIASKGLLLMGNNPSSGFLHTVAAINAELGKLGDARALLLQRMRVENLPEPRDDDWYLFGRIAEQYGLTKDAISMYRRLKRPEDAGRPPRVELRSRRAALEGPRRVDLVP